MKRFLILLLMGALFGSCSHTGSGAADKNAKPAIAKNGDPRPVLSYGGVNYSLPLHVTGIKDPEWEAEIVSAAGRIHYPYYTGSFEEDIDIKIGGKNLRLKQGTEIPFKRYKSGDLAILIPLAEDFETSMDENRVVFKKGTLIYLDGIETCGTAARELALRYRGLEVACPAGSDFAFIRTQLSFVMLKSPAAVKTETFSFVCIGRVSVTSAGAYYIFNTAESLTLQSRDTRVTVPKGSIVGLDGDILHWIVFPEKTVFTVGARKMTVPKDWGVSFDGEGYFLKIYRPM